jgi:short-subunit dehydrogenase
MSRLKIKTILILGSNSDIAQKIVKKINKKKYNVILHYHKNKNLILKKNNHNYLIKADLAKPKEVYSMFFNIKKKYKHLDFIISNFSTYDNPKKIYSLKNYENVFKINVLGNINVILCYTKFFKSLSKKIMFISSNSSLRGSPSLPAYASSKSSLDNLVKSFSKIFQLSNLDICSIQFGPVMTSKLIENKGIDWIKNIKKKLSNYKILTTNSASNIILKILFNKRNTNGKIFKKFF